MSQDYKVTSVLTQLYYTVLNVTIDAEQM